MARLLFSLAMRLVFFAVSIAIRLMFWFGMAVAQLLAVMLQAGWHAARRALPSRPARPSNNAGSLLPPSPTQAPPPPTPAGTSPSFTPRPLRPRPRGRR